MRSALLGLCLLPVLAQAQVFKCVGNDGTTSYSAVPCPASEGQSTRIIEPAPPSGVAPPPLPLPRIQTQGAAEQPQRRDEERADEPPSRGSRVTVIQDSASQSRDARVSEMRERAEREKRESYDRDYDRKRMQQMEQQIRQLQEQNKTNPR
ncbi:DUF4124 domain-containing protein [Pseudomonas tohonis]|uniref:DUF4124 domain-containing protein n=1 Tax=Pseudomonas tohonis TaxID=2725477 RepID=UPI001F47F5DA|nr:DUF4124 domain-containing protein [Pseudomonas tohonis]